MTNETLERIKDIENQKKALNFRKLELEEHIKAIDRQIKHIHDGCDHKRPNGNSAMVGGFFCSCCEICGYSDL